MLTFKSKKAFLKGKFTKISPIYVQFVVSNNCNLTCRMCGRVEARSGEGELTLEEIDRLATVLDQLGCGVIILTGGEPFIREDLPNIVRTFAKRGFEVRLQTNGVLATEENVKAVVNAGLSGLSLSLDSLYPEKQDYINNQKGSWTNTVKAISLFSKVFATRKTVLGVNTVVSRLNIEEIPKIVKFVTAIKFYSSLIPVHLSSPLDGFIVSKRALAFRFIPEDYPTIDSVYGKIIEMRKQGYHVFHSYQFLEESPNFLKYGRTNWSCDSPYLYFSISPSGIFLPCVDLPGSKSMLDSDFVDSYYSEGFQKNIRDAVKNCEGCYRACYPEVSYFCRDMGTFIERIFQGFKVSQTSCKPIRYEEALRLIEDIRDQGEETGQTVYQGSPNKKV
ncbi:MAG: radical SAM protein [Candidatus Brocadiales bacterium]